jgi:hypothetical protein
MTAWVETQARPMTGSHVARREMPDSGRFYNKAVMGRQQGVVEEEYR